MGRLPKEDGGRRVSSTPPSRLGPGRTLVIPMYQEAARIRRTIERLAGSPLDDENTEIIFVDDGSTDGTAGITAEALAATGLRATVIRNEANRGKGASVRTGMLAATGRTLAFADADLSADVTAIEQCFATVRSGTADVVVATRSAPGSVITVHQSPVRQAAGKVFNRALRAMSVTDITDTQCGLKGFTRAAALQLFEPLVIERFAFDVELLLRARASGLAIRELPIEWHHTYASRVRLLRDSSRMLVDVARLRRRMRREARVSGPTMPAVKFDVMSELEQEHWWFRAKRELVRDHVAGRRRRTVAVDVGCGTGAVARMLGDECGYRAVVGTDLNEYALALAAPAVGPRGSVAAARAEELPFCDGSVDCLTSLDVVEHLDDDVLALREYARVLAPDGVMVLSVPAYAWAWSDHDVVLGHRRRYTRTRLLAAAREAGLDVRRCTYFHSWLAPVALLVRRTPLRRLVRKEAEEASFVSPTVNRLLRGVGWLERAALRRADLPFGLSLLLVAGAGSAAGAAAEPVERRVRRAA